MQKIPANHAVRFGRATGRAIHRSKVEGIDDRSCLLRVSPTGNFVTRCNSHDRSQCLISFQRLEEAEDKGEQVGVTCPPLAPSI
ncbi:hypothetical protein CHX26_15295 [Porphyrobacter sp. HT-58-2]|nr:hypothetical protein CHX26_15295 [Porphyrobacter sp. HT-58-2]